MSLSFLWGPAGIPGFSFAVCENSSPCTRQHNQPRDHNGKAFNSLEYNYQINVTYNFHIYSVFTCNEARVHSAVAQL
jgi:hypothetical protein